MKNTSSDSLGLGPFRTVSKSEAAAGARPPGALEPEKCPDWAPGDGKFHGVGFRWRLKGYELT